MFSNTKGWKEKKWAIFFPSTLSMARTTQPGLRIARKNLHFFITSVVLVIWTEDFSL